LREGDGGAFPSGAQDPQEDWGGGKSSEAPGAAGTRLGQGMAPIGPGKKEWNRGEFAAGGTAPPQLAGTAGGVLWRGAGGPGGEGAVHFPRIGPDVWGTRRGQGHPGRPGTSQGPQYPGGNSRQGELGGKTGGGTALQGGALVEGGGGVIQGDRAGGRTEKGLGPWRSYGSNIPILRSDPPPKNRLRRPPPHRQGPAAGKGGLPRHPGPAPVRV